MGAGHSAEGDCGAYASDPPTRNRRKEKNRRRRHSVDSVASYSSQNHVDRIRTQNFSAASCQDDEEFGSIKTSLFRRSSSNLDFPIKRPESVTSNTSSTRSRLRELVERKSCSEEHKSVADTVEDIQYFENPTETLEFDKSRNSLDSRKGLDERPKKRKQSKSKDKTKNQCENKKQEKYQSKLAEYYKLPVQLPQDEFYQHLTRSRAGEELLQKRFSNSDTEFSASYGRLCKHKEIEGSNLRRSRSLAVIREETFTDLQIQNHSKNKRSQLIPRARLFDKPCFRDRLPGRAKYQTREEVLESIYIESTASCFGDINGSRVDDIQENIVEKTSNKEDAISRNESRTSQSLGGSWPNLEEETKQTNLSEDSIGHSRNPSEIDSLDSNYVRKHYNFEAHLKNHKDNSNAEHSITSVNTSKDRCITANGHNSNTEDKEISKYNFLSQTLNHFPVSQSDNKETNQTFPKDDFGSYAEITLINSKSDVPENNEITIIKNTNNTLKDEEFETQSVISENDGTISSPPDSITSYISISIASSTDKSHKLEHLANSLAEKIDEYCDSHFNENKAANQIISDNQINTKTDPNYSKLEKKTFADLATFKGEDHKFQNNELYANIENSGYFKKTNCTSSKNITTEPYVTTIIENQYYSLPDINISRCLRKSERIDAQLRKEDIEDIPYENTYEVTHNNFKEISSPNVSEQYGYLNKPNDSPSQIESKTTINVSQYIEPQVINDFTKLDDDLKSIITSESSNVEELEETYYHQDSHHQNEREINEIESTIRNNKIITKAESLRLSSSVLKPDIKITKSLSNDNINKAQLEKRQKTTIKKHYSLRQRDPTNDDNIRIPSPNSVEKSLQKSIEQRKIKDTLLEEIKNNSILSRVQSFKTSADSNITIVPLSGHQTIVIDPPIIQNLTELTHPDKTKNNTIKDSNVLTQNSQTPLEKFNPISNSQLGEEKTKQSKNSSLSSVETSKLFTPKDPFITIKLNKIVKKTIPQLSKGTSNESIFDQLNIDKPPSNLIIKDTKKHRIVPSIFTKEDKKVLANMTRPQVIQVIDSKSKTNNSLENKQPANSNHTCTKIMNNSKQEKKEVVLENTNEHTVKEKLNNAIKTDIEYQEKINSVKNYWSKLIEKPAECQKTQETKENEENIPENDLITKTEVQVPEKEDTKYVPEISVCSIIKSIESVKIVDSIKKIGQNKLQLWKDETEKVKSDSEIEETTLHKIVKDSKDTTYNKPTPAKNIKKSEQDFCRDTPEIEIVELSNKDNKNQKTQATIIKAKGYDKGCDEFDHVRYKVMKSELFKNSMIANYRKEAQFDGLLQYLQDYSFQELLVNNNIVIIEPVRTKVEPIPRKNNNPDPYKIPSSLLKKNETSSGQIDKSKNAIKRHFFYHPIRVNKEIIEEELPNPDTVKKVRNLFEDTLKMKSPMNQDPPLVEETVRLTRRARSYKNLNEETKTNKISGRKKVIRPLTIDTSFGNKKWDNASLSSGVSSGDLSSNNEFETDGLSSYTNKNLKDNAYSSSDEYLYDSMGQDFCCESQYVSPDILKKIRDCGTSVTYYGGKVLNSKTGSSVSPMTKAIMEEIKSLQKNCSRDCYSCQTKCKGDECSCLVADKHSETLSNKQKLTTAEELSKPSEEKAKRDAFPGFKFKLVKSNSCSSRLELTGTDEIKNPRLKYRKQRSTEDPPLVDDEENSVKNKIYRLESYNKGIVKTPFENNNEDKKTNIKVRPNINKINEINSKLNNINSNQDNLIIAEKEILNTEREQQPVENTTNLSQLEKQNANDSHSFEKKFYYVNENIDQSQITTGKFGEMVFEEFEVLETCYDSLNSNKSLK